MFGFDIVSMTLNDNPLWLLSHIRNSFVISDETGNSGLVLDTAGETYASDQDSVAATLGLGGKEQVWSLTHLSFLPLKSVTRDLVLILKPL